MTVICDNEMVECRLSDVLVVIGLGEGVTA